MHSTTEIKAIDFSIDNEDQINTLNQSKKISTSNKISINSLVIFPKRIILEKVSKLCKLLWILWEI